jgi:hypothetical protein
MRPISTRTLICFISLVLGALLLATRSQSTAGETRKAPAPTTIPSGTGAEQFFELRVYTAAPGKMDALQKRFRDHTVRLFEKHGIKSIGYWTAVDEQHQGRLYYIIAYPNKESREKMLMNGIAKDPEFQKAVAESEKDGKLTAGIESVLMTPTGYSPIK